MKSKILLAIVAIMIALASNVQAQDSLLETKITSLEVKLDSLVEQMNCVPPSEEVLQEYFKNFHAYNEMLNDVFKQNFEMGVYVIGKKEKYREVRSKLILFGVVESCS
jgi:hypothetical protein